MMAKMEMYIRIGCGVLMLIIFQPLIFSFATAEVTNGDWQIMFWFGFILILTAQYSFTPSQFFTGSGIVVMQYIRRILGKEPSSSSTNDGNNDNNASNEENGGRDVGFWTLMPSAFITWIFAKSIQNAVSLGKAFGILGSIAYAGWYLSFFSASIVIYFLRTRHNSSSLPGTIERLYGPIAQILFCLGLLYRLNNEVWSNALVVAGFYGDEKSFSWWFAAITSSIIPAIYVYLGGMRSSLISDVLQAFLAVFFLFIVLIIVGSESDFSISYEPSGGWPEGGWNLLAVAIIQGTISYPFHDPVLTDRCYLAEPKVMLRSFIIGGFVSMIYISIFGIIGIYGAQLSTPTGSPAAIGKALGSAAYVMMNIVFLTSSMSTLDSTFTSTSKILGLDLGGWIKQLRNENDNEIGPLKLNDIRRNKVTSRHVIVGRIGIILMCIAGILPLIENTVALNATTISGTTVMGLGVPVYLSIFWKYGENGWRQSPLCFIFSFGTGVVYGGLYQASSDYGATFTKSLMWGVEFGGGSYELLLACNVWGHLLCIIMGIFGFILDQYVVKWGAIVEMETKMGDDATNGKVDYELERVQTHDVDNDTDKTSAGDTNTQPQPAVADAEYQE